MKPAIRRGGADDARAAADLYLRAREAALRAGSIPAGVHDDDDVRGYFASHIVEDCELWVRRARPAPSPASSCSTATGSTSSTSSPA